MIQMLPITRLNKLEEFDYVSEVFGQCQTKQTTEEKGTTNVQIVFKSRGVMLSQTQHTLKIQLENTSNTLNKHICTLEFMLLISWYLDSRSLSVPKRHRREHITNL